MIDISVLITFYNQKENINRAIESVLMQDFGGTFEIIIGDDGSRDGSIDIIKEWTKQYPQIISYYVRDRNDGVTVGGFRASKNRIELLRRVKGKYFIYLDGDDYYTDASKLRRQFEILENNVTCVACAHDIYRVYQDGRRIPMIGDWLEERIVSAKKYWRELYFHTNTIMFRSSIISNLPECLENNFNDNLITFWAIQYGEIYYLPLRMAAYVQTGDGIWTTGRTRVNAIRNMFIYDLCNMINPKMKFQTSIRLYKCWNDIWKIRKEFSADEMKELLDEAEAKDCLYTQMFIRYNSLSVLKKMKLGIVYKKIKLENQFVKIENCIYKFVKGIR